MIGLSRRITASALVPRRERTSAASRCLIRVTAAGLGLISSFAPPYRRILNPRKSKPSSTLTMWVLSTLNESPRGVSHWPSLFQTCSSRGRSTVVQSNSPPAYRGRTMALFNMSQMLSTAGSMLIGLLAFVVGSRGAVAAMGIAGVLGIVILVWLMPRARQIK